MHCHTPKQDICALGMHPLREASVLVCAPNTTSATPHESMWKPQKAFSVPYSRAMTPRPSIFVEHVRNLPHIILHASKPGEGAAPGSTQLWSHRTMAVVYLPPEQKDVSRAYLLRRRKIQHIILAKKPQHQVALVAYMQQQQLPAAQAERSGLGSRAHWVTSRRLVISPASSGLPTRLLTNPTRVPGRTG